VINNRDKKTLRAFGKRLQELRKRKKLSQEELYFETDLSKNVVGMIERGEVNPTLTTIKELAKGLGVTKKELMDFE
jgi:transcriptional regulator with XRE-family HTH domain